jgi:hypothetical protein
MGVQKLSSVDDVIIIIFVKWSNNAKSVDFLVVEDDLLSANKSEFSG